MLVGLLAAVGNPVVDTLMVARYSAIDLASLAVGASLYVCIFVALMGVMQSLMPTFGQMYGAGQFAAMGDMAKQGIWLALCLSLLGASLLFFPAPLSRLAKTPLALRENTTLYLRILAFSLPASLLFLVYGTLNNAMARPHMVMALQVGVLMLKIPLNWMFIFGYLNIPALGGAGCALATCLLAWLSVVTGWLILRWNPFYRFLHLFDTGMALPDTKKLGELLKLGLPLGINSFIEVTSFNFMALFIARIGIEAVAAHQIVANIAIVLYMLPLTAGSATSTLVAQSIGARQLLLARRIAFSGRRLAACIAVLMACLTWFAREELIALYTHDPRIADNALPLIVFVCSYQFFYAIQITSAYVLRAYKVVLAPTLLYLSILWGIGLGGGYILAFDVLNLMPPASITRAGGFWFSYTVGVSLLAISLTILIVGVQRRAERLAGVGET